jgi:Tfp pilus assembly protein PilF
MNRSTQAGQLRSGSPGAIHRCAGSAQTGVQRGLIIVIVTALVAGCTGSATKPNARFDLHDDSGFSITEDVRVGSDVRTDYEVALRHLEAERYEQGIALLVRVTERAPNVTASHIDLGIAYSRTGDLERAAASLEQALSLNPRHPVAHNELGMVFRKMGRFAAARDSYEKALDVHPLFHYARRNLAILCDVYLSDLSCALEHYEVYRQAVPDDEEAAMWISDLRNRVTL